MSSDGLSQWQKVELGELCLFRAGSAFKPDRQGKPLGAYPFVKVRDLSNAENVRFIHTADNWVDDADVTALKAKPFNAGTVVFAKIGEALKANRFRVLVRDTLLDNNMMGATPNRACVEPEFFPYLLQELNLPDLATGSAMPYLKQSDLTKVQAHLPPTDEQRRIARVLGSLDDKIESNRRLAKTLEEIAAALFKARFVDFIGHGDLVESEVGPIPRGWRAMPVSAIARYVNGKALTKFGNGRGRMVIRIAELRSGPGAATVYTDHETTADHIANPGDLLFAWSGSLDVYRWYRPEALINQHIFKVIPQGYPPWFVFHALRHVMPNFQAIAADKATTMGHIKRSHLDEFAIAAPSAEALGRHDPEFAPIFERVLQARLEIETIRATRDRLLPKLISGEIRVSPDVHSAPEAA